MSPSLQPLCFFAWAFLFVALENYSPYVCLNHLDLPSQTSLFLSSPLSCFWTRFSTPVILSSIEVEWQDHLLVRGMRSNDETNLQASTFWRWGLFFHSSHIFQDCLVNHEALLECRSVIMLWSSRSVGEGEHWPSHLWNRCRLWEIYLSHQVGCRIHLVGSGDRDREFHFPFSLRKDFSSVRPIQHFQDYLQFCFVLSEVGGQRAWYLREEAILSYMSLSPRLWLRQSMTQGSKWVVSLQEHRII